MSSDGSLERTPAELQSVGVVGAGEMGPGIALTFARFGYGVTLVDQYESALADGLDDVDRFLTLLDDRDLLSEDRETIRSRIETATELTALADADYVTEAVTEALDVKQEVFGALDDVCADDVVLASNTSSLDVDEIARATDRPSQVIVTHWMNPPWVVPVVEVVTGETTAAETEAFVLALLEDVEKSPVVLSGVVPGYLINRMNFAIAREALSMIEEGVVTKEDVDTLFTEAFGPRYTLMGPIEMLDLFGHDTNLAISEYVFPSLSDADTPPALLEELVEAGDLGMKTGRGFYAYDASERETVEEIDRRLLDRYLELGRF